MEIIWLVLGIYLFLLFVIAGYFSRGDGLESYLLNERDSNIWLMTLSNFSSMIGAGATVAIVAEVYNTGISYGLALPIALMFGAFIMGKLSFTINKVGRAYDVSSLPAFFGQRYDEKTKRLTGLLQIALAAVWISIHAAAFGSLVSVLTDLTYTTAITVASLATILYTAIGGLKIDLISDFIQFWIIISIFILMGVLAWLDLGTNVVAQLPRGHLDPFAFGGVSWFIGVIVLSGFIYAGNTAYWQRILSAESPETARNSFYYTIPIFAVFTLIVLYLGLYSVVTLDNIVPDNALFLLMEDLLPQVLAGIGFAAILAVIMSSIDSLLVGGSTVVYEEYVEQRFPGVVHARALTGLFGIFGFLIAIFIPDIVTLSLLLTYLALVFAPPAFAALYSETISSDAVFWAILVGTVVLAITFPTVGKNSFVFSTLASVVITLGYDLLR